MVICYANMNKNSSHEAGNLIVDIGSACGFSLNVKMYIEMLIITNTADYLVEFKIKTLSVLFLYIRYYKAFYSSHCQVARLESIILLGIAQKHSHFFNTLINYSSIIK